MDALQPRFLCVEANRSQPRLIRAAVQLICAFAREPIALGRELSEQVRSELPRFLADFPTAHVFLVEDRGAQSHTLDSDFVGVAVCVRSLSTFHSASVMNIHDLFVLESYRGQGLARLLLESVESTARRLGCCGLTLEVHRDNARALEAYRRFGFADGLRALPPGVVWYLEKTLKD